MTENNVIYDVRARMYVVSSTAKNASVKTKTYLRPSGAINEVSHKPWSLQTGPNVISNTKTAAAIFVTYF